MGENISLGTFSSSGLGIATVSDSRYTTSAYGGCQQYYNPNWDWSWRWNCPDYGLTATSAKVTAADDDWITSITKEWKEMSESLYNSNGIKSAQRIINHLPIPNLDEMRIKITRF